VRQSTAVDVSRAAHVSDGALAELSRFLLTAKVVAVQALRATAQMSAYTSFTIL
jgi:hypothetical protein